MNLLRRFTRPSGVSVKQYESWDDFRHALRSANGDPNEQRIYRGHAYPDWKLSSTWERRIGGHFEIESIPPDPGLRRLLRSSGKYEQLRDTELAVFKRLTKTMHGIPLQQSDPDEDWWAFGRHYGLNTPLLDWSRNPYIAAFWAFSERLIYENPHLAPIGGPTPNAKSDSSGPVVVWELLCSDTVFSPEDFRFIDNVRFEFHRQSAQKGVFTWLEHYEHTDVESYLSSKDCASFLSRHEIFLSNSIDALSDLDKTGINYGSVFPDSDGAARQSIFSSRGFVDSSIFRVHANWVLDIIRQREASSQISRPPKSR